MHIRRETFSFQIPKIETIFQIRHCNSLRKFPIRANHLSMMSGAPPLLEQHQFNQEQSAPKNELPVVILD